MLVLPFKSKKDTFDQVVHKIMYQDFEPIPENIGYSAQLIMLIHSLLEKDPSKRPSVSGIWREVVTRPFDKSVLSARMANLASEDQVPPFEKLDEMLLKHDLLTKETFK
jgi:hypothetical protein